MLRHKDILQGLHFKWVTDHKGLIHLLKEKTVSGRQSRWLEKISSFVFEVAYAAENILPRMIPWVLLTRARRDTKVMD